MFISFVRLSVYPTFHPEPLRVVRPNLFYGARNPGGPGRAQDGAEEVRIEKKKKKRKKKGREEKRKKTKKKEKNQVFPRRAQSRVPMRPQRGPVSPKEMRERNKKGRKFFLPKITTGWGPENPQIGTASPTTNKEEWKESKKESVPKPPCQNKN
jgi:hypothetical protein